MLGRISLVDNGLGWSINIHLRVKDASCSLNNTNSLIESLDLINRTCLTGHNGNDVESQVLGVEISCEAERQSLLLASWNLNIISGMGQVADDGCGRVNTRCQWLQGRQCPPNDCDVNWLGLVVGEIKERLCRVPIYEFHAKDFRLREGGRDRDGEIGGCWGRLELFFCLDNEGVSMLG